MFSNFKVTIASVSILFLFCSSTWASGSHKHDMKKSEAAAMVKGTQKVCPIRKEAIDPTVSIEYQGQKIYFCCSGCDEKFLKDPESYFAEMKKRGEVTESIQTVCPVSGDVLDKDKMSLTLPGRKVHFCCKKCVSKFKKSSKVYLKKMDVKTKVNAPSSHEGHDHSGHQH
jgi:YHS domain-containing protein